MNAINLRPHRWTAMHLVSVARRGLALVLLVLAIPASGQEVTAVRGVGMTVSDLDKAIAFYTGVLPFEKVSEAEIAGDAFEHLQGVFGARARLAQLRLGDEVLTLTEYLAPKGRPLPVDFRSNDHWFQHVAIVVSDMDAAYQRLRSNGVQYASSGPQRLPDWNPAAGGIEAFYFRDPDGHHLELIHFPPGKGDPKWQMTGGALFLGIDHTAIVVSDTDQSLAFYRDLLGMRVAGESENYGTEQEHLNNVFGARLRITALRAPAGPGIEFLEYLAPAGGRPTPADINSNDLMHWQTTLTVSDIGRVSEKLFVAKESFVSNGAVEMRNGLAGFTKGLLVRDRDGHAMLIVEEPGVN